MINKTYTGTPNGIRPGTNTIEEISKTFSGINKRIKPFPYTKTVFETITPERENYFYDTWAYSNGKPDSSPNITKDFKKRIKSYQDKQIIGLLNPITDQTEKTAEYFKLDAIFELNRRYESDIKKKLIQISNCSIDFKYDLSDMYVIISKVLSGKLKRLEELLQYEWCYQSEYTYDITIAKRDDYFKDLNYVQT